MIVSGLNHYAHKTPSRNDPPNKYKRYFSNKLNEAKNSYNSVQPLLRAGFDALEIYGGTAEAMGLMAAPFTEGASLPLAARGAQMSLLGMSGNVTMDLIDLNFDSAAYRLIKFGASFGMGKAFEALPYKNFSYILDGYKEVLDTYIAPVLEDSWNKFNPQPNKLKL